MGDPRKPKKKYAKPSHPWQKARIEAEKELKNEYGVKNKRELWKMDSLVRGFHRQVKRYVASSTDQSKKEKGTLLIKLRRLGLIKESGQIDDVLGLGVKDIMERRLQTLVHRKNLAKTVKQSRQFIVHGHISIGGRTITSPSKIVSVNEESIINFSPLSTLSSSDHPERTEYEGAKAAQKKPKKAGKREDRKRYGKTKKMKGKNYAKR